MQASTKNLILEELITDIQPLIACESPLQERNRFLLYLAEFCTSVGKQCFIWNLGEETVKEMLVRNGKLTLTESHIYKPNLGADAKNYFEVLKFWKDYTGSGVLIIENVYPWIGDNTPNETDFFLASQWIKSSLLNIKLYNHDSGKTAILLGHFAQISSDLAAQIPLVVQNLPDINEITESLQAANIIAEPTPSNLQTIANAGIGLYIADILNILEPICRSSRSITATELANTLFLRKVDLLDRVYSIQFIPPSSVPLGGLDLMQDAFLRFRRLLTPFAKSYKLRVPKGIMLVGPPGTGKSHSAKIGSQIIGVPLILVDWGGFRSYGNEAESKLKQLLRLADRLDQVIVYFDDFDKGFAGDDDLARRLAGQLLTWMQERTSDVIVIASVNRMEALPPELTRAGRFDYLFKVDLPNNGERHTIFKIHLARFDKRFRNGGDPFTQDEWRRLLKETNRCVGAEIQTIVERAAASIFCQMFPNNSVPEDTTQLPPLEFTIAALVHERTLVNPLAIREADKVETMRNRADAQALPSSRADDSQYAMGNVNIFS